MDKRETWLDEGFSKRVFGGLLIGVTFLLPGVSGGAMAASLGYFEPAIAAISGFFRDKRTNARYLLPLAIGGAIGILLTALVLSRLLQSAETQMLCLFMGMIIGSVPLLWRTTYQQRPERRHWLLIALGLACVLVLLLINPNQETVDAGRPWGLWQALLSGGVMGFGAVIPGISGTFLLLYFGWFAPLMDALARLDVLPILLVGVGYVLMTLGLASGASWLFRHHRRAAFSLVIGFIIGSIALIYPADFFGSLWWANILMTALGMAAGLSMGRVNKA